MELCVDVIKRQPKGTIKALRLQRHRASSTASEFTAKLGVADGLTIVLSGAGKGCAGERIYCLGKTYTFHAQDVYVFTAKRIRFTHDTYTFGRGKVHVRPIQAMR